MSIIDSIVADPIPLITSVVMVAVSVLIAKLISVAIRRRMRGNYSDNLTKVTSRFTYYLIIVVGVILAAGNMGVNLASALVAGGIIGIVLGFAAQSSVSNLIAGILLIADKPFSIGDYITYNDITAGIIEIGLLSTSVATWDGIRVRIPNNLLFNSEVKNYTRSIARMVRMQVTLFYEENMERVLRALEGEFSKQWYVLVEPAPVAFVSQFTNTGITLELRVWTAGSTWWNLYSNMPEIVTHTLKRMKVRFAYPKRIYVNPQDGRQRPHISQGKKSNL